MKVTIKGVADLEKSLEQFSKATGRAVMRRALRKAARPIADTAKSYAPYEEGDLEKSIKIVTSTTNGPDAGKAAYAKTMSAGGSRETALGAMRDARRADNSISAAVFVTARDPAAHLVEFGTDERFHASGKSVGKMTPDPFMRPAFDLKASVARSIITEELAREIQKTATRLAAKARRDAAMR